MVIQIVTGINWMKKGKKGLIASLFEWIDFPWSKVRWRTNVAVLLLDFLYKTLKMVKSMVKTIGKSTTEIDLMIAIFDYIYKYIYIYIYIYIYTRIYI